MNFSDKVSIDNFLFCQENGENLFLYVRSIISTPRWQKILQCDCYSCFIIWPLLLSLRKRNCSRPKVNKLKEDRTCSHPSARSTLQPLYTSVSEIRQNWMFCYSFEILKKVFLRFWQENAQKKLKSLYFCLLRVVRYFLKGQRQSKRL